MRRHVPDQDHGSTEEDRVDLQRYRQSGREAPLAEQVGGAVVP